MLSLLYIFLGVGLSFISSRYIFGGDSAEFSAIAHTWSIAHPPGYPLYSLLLNIITHSIPFGTIPWRASLLSVIPTVATAFLLYRILKDHKVRPFLAIISSLLYCVLFPVFEYTLVPEVFALNSLLVIGISYLLLRYEKMRHITDLYIAFFLMGLCVAHHHIFLIFVPAWTLLLWDLRKQIIGSSKSLLILIVSFLLGTLFYLYAPLASIFNPPIQWEDAKTLSGFWRLITRAMYGTFTAYGGAKGDIANQLYDVFSLFVLLFQDFRAIGTVGIGIGVYVSLKKRSVLSRFLIVSSLSHIFFLFYTNFVLRSPFTVAMYERFLISFYAVLIIYLGLGCEWMVEKSTTFVVKHSNKRSLHMLLTVCIALFFSIYIGTVAVTNYQSVSTLTWGQQFDRLGKDIIQTVPPSGIYYPGNDNSHFTTLFHVVSEPHAQNNILFQMNLAMKPFYINQFKKKHPSLVYPPTMKTQQDVKQFIALNAKRGVYLESPTSYGFWMPYGLLWKYYNTQKEAMNDLTAIVSENTRLWKSVYHIPILSAQERNILHLQTIQDYYVESYMNYAKLLFLAKHTEEAKQVLNAILLQYRPSNSHVKIALINLLVAEKNCVSAQRLLLDITERDEFTTTLINYYSVCDAQNIRLQKLKERHTQLIQKSETSLDLF